MPLQTVSNPYTDLLAGDAIQWTKNQTTTSNISPVCGRSSRYFVDAYLTVFRVYSADVPPITMAR
jgi:hypothetical protein